MSWLTGPFDLRHKCKALACCFMTLLSSSLILMLGLVVWQAASTVIGSVMAASVTVAIGVLEIVTFFVFLLCFLPNQFFTALSTTGMLSRTGGPLIATCIRAFSMSDFRLDHALLLISFHMKILQRNVSVFLNGYWVMYTIVKTINGKAEFLTLMVFKKKPWMVNRWKPLWVLFLKHACFFKVSW